MWYSCFFKNIKTAMASGSVPTDYKPRVIYEDELPEDAVIMYHATNDLPGLQQHGLVNQNERRQWGWGASKGIGGGSPETVSLTRKKEIAESIARGMKDMHTIMKSQTPAEAMTVADSIVQNLCQEYNIDNFRSISYHAKSLISRAVLGNSKGDIEIEKSQFDDLARGVKRKYSGVFKPSPDELPEGSTILKMWEYSTPENPMVSVWEEPMSREEWTYIVAKYFDLMLEELERKGGPTSPYFWGYDEKQFSNFDPEHVGVAEIMVTGPPDKWDKEYYPDWSKGTPGGLEEWAGHPDKTRVILRR